MTARPAEGKEMSDIFYGYHPIVNFAYFAAALAFAMFFTHPVCLAVSLVCAFAYSVYINGKKALRFNLIYMLPMLIFAALLNPAFNHQGGTILTYLPSGNPLTLESILYGVAAAVMLVTVISWFSCFNAVMTSDKFVYLFGRIIPALSLILSMALRFVPRFRAQIKVISSAQRNIGRDVSSGSLWRRAKHGIKILSIMVTWALENAIETADSMKGRGYGLPGRTAFSIYRFDRRDAAALGFVAACAAYVLIGSATGGLEWRYFPTVRGTWNGAYTISVFAVYLALCVMPLILNAREDFKWRTLKATA
jgi:energy-coupling factor transport system permease protein